MTQAKGKANYKTDALIQVVEELLPNGAQGWTEVARLYQVHTGELAVREYDDVKCHWIKKCCNKFKKPTGNPGDPKRDMILRCRQIQERIHEKSSSLILGVDSGGDTGLSISTNASDDDEESEEENGLEPELEVVVADNAGVAGSAVGSRTATPNALLEVRVGVIAPEQVEAGIPSVPHTYYTTIHQGKLWYPSATVDFFTGGNVPLATAEGASGDYTTICPADGSPADVTSTSPANAAA
jgi:hypothetical protein